MKILRKSGNFLLILNKKSWELNVGKIRKFKFRRDLKLKYLLFCFILNTNLAH